MTRLLMLMGKKSWFMRTPGIGRSNRAGVFLTGLLISVSVMAQAGTADSLAAGKVLAMEKSKGNCLACHVIADGKQPGNIGPPLIGMKARFPETEDLFKQIWDATQNNPDTRMPPFGRHGILSREEINLIIEYLYTL